MSSLKTEKQERRKSVNENDEISMIFQQKIEMAESIKRYVSMKVNYQMKKFEEKIAQELINKFLDELEKATSKMIERIEK